MHTHMSAAYHLHRQQQQQSLRARMNAPHLQEPAPHTHIRLPYQPAMRSSAFFFLAALAAALSAASIVMRFRRSASRPSMAFCNHTHTHIGMHTHRDMLSRAGEGGAKSGLSRMRERDRETGAKTCKPIKRGVCSSLLLLLLLLTFLLATSASCSARMRSVSRRASSTFSRLSISLQCRNIHKHTHVNGVGKQVYVSPLVQHALQLQ